MGLSMPRPATSDDELESYLAGFVRSYMQTSRGRDPAGQEDALQKVCTGLEYLLGRLLSRRVEWRGWVDGVIPATEYVPDSIQVISMVELSVRGCALWAKGSRGPFWIEPFLGCVRISETRDAIVGYQIHFGDASRGLANVPYDKHLRRPDWFHPAQWLFSFSNGTVDLN
jgi:hypothetical protein